MQILGKIPTILEFILWFHHFIFLFIRFSLPLPYFKDMNSFAHLCISSTDLFGGLLHNIQSKKQAVT